MFIVKGLKLNVEDDSGLEEKCYPETEISEACGLSILENRLMLYLKDNCFCWLYICVVLIDVYHLSTDHYGYGNTTERKPRGFWNVFLYF